MIYERNFPYIYMLSVYINSPISSPINLQLVQVLSTNFKSCETSYFYWEEPFSIYLIFYR